MATLRWPAPRLEVGESVLLERRANWSLGRLARGGTLVLTDRRLIFEPNSMEAGAGLPTSSWAADAIKHVDIAPSTRWHPFSFSGGVRRRLRIGLRDGSIELFVVDDVDRLADELTQRLPAVKRPDEVEDADAQEG